MSPCPLAHVGAVSSTRALLHVVSVRSVVVFRVVLSGFAGSVHITRHTGQIFSDVAALDVELATLAHEAAPRSARKVHVHCHLQFESEMLDAIYANAKFKFECGIYSDTSQYLEVFRMLVSGRMKEWQC